MGLQKVHVQKRNAPPVERCVKSSYVGGPSKCSKWGRELSWPRAREANRVADVSLLLAEV